MDQNTEDLSCSFCSKNKDEVSRLIAGPGVYICDECIDSCYNLIQEQSIKDKKDQHQDWNYTPKDLFKSLNEYVIGQSHAKKVLSVAVYNHYKRLKSNYVSNDVELDKSNILLIGPTGSGKTLLAQSLARFLDVPFAVADATTLTEAGYVGDDVENVIKSLLSKCDFDPERAEQGIIFIDEIDKVASRANAGGADVSREGVQRDLLPLVEGSTVNTKHGPIKTDHILFIASGAFHLSKPSDLIPELQGRLPIRVELSALSVKDFELILKEPDYSLTEQYIALMKTEGIDVTFDKSAITRLSKIAWTVNEKTENIGARRLHTIMERLLEKLSFEASDISETKIKIDADYVDKYLNEFAENEDLSRYIL